MDEMVTIYLFGKKYDVPADLTIMRAMEYAGYQLCLLYTSYILRRILWCLRLP